MTMNEFANFIKHHQEFFEPTACGIRCTQIPTIHGSGCCPVLYAAVRKGVDKNKYEFANSNAISFGQEIGLTEEAIRAIIVAADTTSCVQKFLNEIMYKDVV